MKTPSSIGIRFIGAADFASIFTAGAVTLWTINILWLAVLAAPFSWVWNWAAVPLGSLPAIGYVRVFGLLMLWFLLRQAHVGLKLSARSQDRDRR
ncbi:MAG TPA: hypothetical protein VG936_10990 [Lacunisphaera sp.]|nr:hypothetical protein [Lacunisphaera sp.]